MNPPPSSVIPAPSRPSSPVLGTIPTVSRQCEPRTVRPSSRVTVTPSPEGLADIARDRPSTVMPRRRNTSSTTIAASLRQPAVARGDQGDLRAQRLVRAGELGPGHSRADHDQLLGQFVQVV